MTFLQQRLCRMRSALSATASATVPKRKIKSATVQKRRKKWASQRCWTGLWRRNFGCENSPWVLPRRVLTAKASSRRYAEKNLRIFRLQSLDVTYFNETFSILEEDKVLTKSMAWVQEGAENNSADVKTGHTSEELVVTRILDQIMTGHTIQYKL